MMKCPLKFARYEFEGGTDCIGDECGFFGGVCDMDSAVSVQKCPNVATNGMRGETNGIADGITLPDGDAVAILRDSDDGSVRMKAFAYDPHSLSKLADMIERDYVRRESIEEVMDTDRELVAENIRLRAERDELTNAINELQKKQPYCYDPEVPLDTLRTVGRYIDELQAERDEWKAKAEGSSKVRAGSSSAKRAAAVERVRKAKDAGTSIGYAIVGREYYPWEAYETLIDLLTDDDTHSTTGNMTEQPESLSDEADSRENGWYLRYDGYMTSKSNYLRISGFKAARALDNHQNLVFVKFMGGKEADCRVYAPKLDVCEKLHDSSGETQKPRSKEANPENMSDSDGENLHVEHDSREKLEDDVGFIVKEGFVTYKSIIGWLDRQAAITERECLVQSVQGADAILTAENAELQAKVDELYKSCDVLRDKKLAAEREKSELTEQLEAAHAKNRALKLHISKMQQGRHGWNVKGAELQRQVDELTAQLHASNAERARLRECLGIATDNAHDLLTLVDESGNVSDRDEGLA